MINSRKALTQRQTDIRMPLEFDKKYSKNDSR